MTYMRPSLPLLQPSHALSAIAFQASTNRQHRTYHPHTASPPIPLSIINVNTQHNHLPSRVHSIPVNTIDLIPHPSRSFRVPVSARTRNSECTYIPFTSHLSALPDFSLVARPHIRASKLTPRLVGLRLRRLCCASHPRPVISSPSEPLELSQHLTTHTLYAA
ncbi:hypothetical protein BD311DRAFT_757812 [Dichomitus squalens]|uniref:Uncharacterized protein n=1 Tax=Dichomitus squalens TaxID=114155 RepID=A0A4Q9MM69_9APHY|nr:hypothetical protein BD311DRAFT_757812 [Dichomitus squalens]